jgi:hypothetical protein
LKLSRGAQRLKSFFQSKQSLSGESWWSLPRIARELGDYNERSVRRWADELRAAGELAWDRRGSTSNLWKLQDSSGQNVRIDRTKCPNASLEVNLKKEKIQHPSDDVEPIRKAAGFESLSEGDRRYLVELQRGGTSAEAIRAGVLVGRARRMMADSRGAPQAVRSLRYFAGPIAEAARGEIPAGYVEYVEGWLQRKLA